MASLTSQQKAARTRARKKRAAELLARKRSLAARKAAATRKRNRVLAEREAKRRTKKPVATKRRAKKSVATKRRTKRVVTPKKPTKKTVASRKRTKRPPVVKRPVATKRRTKRVVARKKKRKSVLSPRPRYVLVDDFRDALPYEVITDSDNVDRLLDLAVSAPTHAVLRLRNAHYDPATGQIVAENEAGLRYRFYLLDFDGKRRGVWTTSEKFAVSFETEDFDTKYEELSEAASLEAAWHVPDFDDRCKMREAGGRKRRCIRDDGHGGKHQFDPRGVSWEDEEIHS